MSDSSLPAPTVDRRHFPLDDHLAPQIVGTWVHGCAADGALAFALDRQTAFEVRYLYPAAVEQMSFADTWHGVPLLYDERLGRGEVLAFFDAGVLEAYRARGVVDETFRHATEAGSLDPEVTTVTTPPNPDGPHEGVAVGGPADGEVFQMDSAVPLLKFHTMHWDDQTRETHETMARYRRSGAWTRAGRAVYVPA